MSGIDTTRENTFLHTATSRGRQRAAVGRIREFEAIDDRQNQVLGRIESDPVLFMNRAIGHAVMQDLEIDPHMVTKHAVAQAAALAMEYKDMFISNLASEL